MVCSLFVYCTLAFFSLLQTAQTKHTLRKNHHLHRASNVDVKSIVKHSLVNGSSSFANDEINNNKDEESSARNKMIDDEELSFQRFQLEAHNEYRKIHGAPPLELDEQMSKEAEEYAKKLSEEGKWEHMARKEQEGGEQAQHGENLGFVCNHGEIKDEFATRKWYDEICDPGYDFGGHGHNHDTAHFTQVVWKESTKFGIGKVFVKQQDGLNCFYFVARYSPRGNIDGKYQDNVLQGSFDRSAVCGYSNKFNKERGDSVSNENNINEEHEDNTLSNENNINKENEEEENNQILYRKRQLKIHNDYRQIHNAPPLILDKELSTEAQDKAEMFAASHTKPQRSGFGENVGYVCQGEAIDEVAEDNIIHEWYKEVCNHQFGKVSKANVGFMQVVWKASYKFGIGMARTVEDDMHCIYVVAKYWPFMSIYRGSTQVLKGSFDRTKECGKSIDVYSFTDYQKRQLKIHNEYRQRHDAPPLKLNAQLSKQAKNYANTMGDHHWIIEERSPPSGYGENLGHHCQDRYAMIGKEAEDTITRNWYKEVCNPGYWFGNSSFLAKKAAHFMQVVWKESTKLGIDVAHIKTPSGRNCIYVAARYDGPMSVTTRSTNVQKGSFMRKEVCE